MGSSSQDSKNRQNSRKLRDTLGELESALNSWDQIIPPGDDNSVNADGGTANANEPRSRKNAGAGIPDEMKRRTRALLNQLKEQIDELSDETAADRAFEDKSGNA